MMKVCGLEEPAHVMLAVNDDGKLSAMKFWRYHIRLHEYDEYTLLAPVDMLKLQGIMESAKTLRLLRCGLDGHPANEVLVMVLAIKSIVYAKAEESAQDARQQIEKQD